MEPLDLTKHPPRSPWDRLDGLVFLPRTIGKMRASLLGGNIGPYWLGGFSQRMLETFDVCEAGLRAVIERASCDGDVAEWLLTNANIEEYERVNGRFTRRRLCDLLNRFPEARNAPREALIFDLLVFDNARSFPALQPPSGLLKGLEERDGAA